MTIWLGMKRGSKWIISGILIALVVAAVFSFKILNKSGGLEKTLYSAAAFSGSSYSVYARQDMMGAAWREYQDNPILGSSIVERQWLSYPHNAVLESFMATGTFGGVAFVLMMAIATWRAFRIMRRDVSISWLPLCFFQQLIGAMFSGGIYGNFVLFGLTGIMLGVELPNGYFVMAPTGYSDTRIGVVAAIAERQNETGAEA
jgi:O-antigen ligase